jgi:phage repressor protein C with HTH and peptisase S24 domain
MLKSTGLVLSAITDTMVDDPTSLFDRLMAVKPAGMSSNAWTVAAGLSRNALNDIKRRGTAHPHTIDKLLEAIGQTKAEFEAGAQASHREASPAAARAPYLAFRGDDRPRDIPIVGTALCADVEIGEDGETVEIEAMEMDLDELVDHARRPLALDNRRDVYALYFRGVSMAPRYEPGELGYVDPRRPPTTGDYVVAQLRQPDHEDGERIFLVMAKRLVRQTAKFYEFEQFNPPLVFQIERSRVAHLHRIIPWDELVTF